MAYDQEEINILRNELDNLWQCLDNIASSENQTGEDQLKTLEENNTLLKLELAKFKREHLDFQKVLKFLQQILNSLFKWVIESSN